ncbi:dienelactone hydrolase family protein [Streptomyces sp. NPDC008121]|uniref:dienelactone hydrolase family protein n=1 Tax=Streptomyces sp. NPDC008121 TaxID=3364809 RepID=UPI0036E8856D
MGPSQAHGVLGIPAGTGPRPVVVVVHGNHPTCVEPEAKNDGVAARPVKTTWPLVCAEPGKPKELGVGPDYLRHDAGVSYLVQALARKGFVAVAMDVKGAEAWWAGEAHPVKAYNDLFDAHLKLLSDLDKGRNRGLAISGAQGRIDTSRIGVVGHSRGGGYALEHTAERPGLFAAVAIEPAANGDGSRHKVPVLNIRGACDEDAGPDAGLEETKALAASRTTPVAADVVLAGTGHAMLNTNLAPAKSDGSVGACRASQATRPDVARDQVAQLTADFMQQALLKATAYRLPALKGPAPTGRNLHSSGPRLTFTPAAPQTYSDPHAIRQVSTPQRLLPPLPTNLTISKGEPG